MLLLLAISLMRGLLPAQLYNALWNHISDRSEVSELTIEDPSEHFEDLRDRNDLTRLRKLLGQSKEILAGAPVDKAWMESMRKKLKYAKVRSASCLRWPIAALMRATNPQRQFLRIIEIMLLEQLKYKQGDPDAYKALRLQVSLPDSATATFAYLLGRPSRSRNGFTDSTTRSSRN